MNQVHVNVTSEQAINHTPYCAPLVPHVCLTRATYEESLCRRFHQLFTILFCVPLPRSESRQARDRSRWVLAFCMFDVCLIRLLRSDLRVVIVLHGFDNMQGSLLFFLSSRVLLHSFFKPSLFWRSISIRLSDFGCHAFRFVHALRLLRLGLPRLHRVLLHRFLLRFTTLSGVLRSFTEHQAVVTVGLCVEKGSRSRFSITISESLQLACRIRISRRLSKIKHSASWTLSACISRRRRDFRSVVSLSSGLLL